MSPTAPLRKGLRLLHVDTGDVWQIIATNTGYDHDRVRIALERDPLNQHDVDREYLAGPGWKKPTTRKREASR
jgi:hypothetical protein